jgi:hypothetical protein
VQRVRAARGVHVGAHSFPDYEKIGKILCNVYVRHVECTWVAHSFPDYEKLGKSRIVFPSVAEPHYFYATPVPSKYF